MGGEVVDPRRTIPHSCILTCAVVLVVYILTYIAVVGFLPWDGPEGEASPAISRHLPPSPAIIYRHLFSPMLL